MAASSGRPGSAARTQQVAYFDRTSDVAKESEIGQFNLQVVKAYTQPLPQGYVSEELREKLYKQWWQLLHPKRVKWKAFKPLLTLGLERSQSTVQLLVVLMLKTDYKAPIWAACFGGPKSEDLIGVVLAKTLLRILKGEEADGDIPAVEPNPGRKAAVILTMFSLLFAPYPKPSQYANKGCFQAVEFLKDELMEYMFPILALLLDPTAPYTKMRRHNLFLSTLNTMQQQLGYQTPPSPVEIGLCIVHCYTISHLDMHVTTGADRDRMADLCAFENGLLVKLVNEHVNTRNSRVERSEMGAPTAENTTKVMQNLIASGVVLNSNVLSDTQQQHWTDIVCKEFVQTLKAPDGQLTGSGYGSDKVAKEAAAIGAYQLMTVTERALNVFASEEVIKLYLKMWGDSKESRNNAICALDGLMTHATNRKDVIKKLRYARLPSKLLDVILLDPDAGDDFQNRRFQAISALGKLIGRVKDHPYLTQAGENMFSEVVATLRGSLKFYTDYSVWRADIGKTQNVLIQPAAVLACLNALLSTQNNRLAFAERGVVHYIAELMDIMVKASLAEHEAHLRQQEEYNKTDANTTTARERSGADDLDAVSSIAALTKLAEDVDVIEDLEMGFETKDIKLENIAEHFTTFLATRPEKQALAEEARVMIRVAQVKHDPDQGIEKYLKDNPGATGNDVFISYSWRDGHDNGVQFGTSKLANWLAVELKAQHELTSFLDRTDMAATPGRTLDEKMHVQLATTKSAVVCLIDHSYHASANCMFELKNALVGSTPVFPVFLNFYKHTSLPSEYLSLLKKHNVQWFEALSADEDTKNWTEGRRPMVSDKMKDILADLAAFCKNKAHQSKLTNSDIEDVDLSFGTQARGSGSAAKLSGGGGGMSKEDAQLMQDLRAEVAALTSKLESSLGGFEARLAALEAASSATAAAAPPLEAED